MGLATNEGVNTKSDVPKTKIWSFFNVRQHNKFPCARCKICKMKLQSKDIGYNSAHIRNHLRYKHPDVYIQFLLTEETFLKEEKALFQNSNNSPLCNEEMIDGSVKNVKNGKTLHETTKKTNN